MELVAKHLPCMGETLSSSSSTVFKKRGEEESPFCLNCCLKSPPFIVINLEYCRILSVYQRHKKLYLSHTGTSRNSPQLWDTTVK
jgi:hypothetical protein